MICFNFLGKASSKLNYWVALKLLKVVKGHFLHSKNLFDVNALTPRVIRTRFGLSLCSVTIYCLPYNQHMD